MMKMRFKILGCLILSAMSLASSVAVAEDSPHEFSANVAMSTDYRFRGISQTREGPALSGGFDYTYAPYGMYAGVWASNLDFAESAGPVLDNATLEIDYYGGFSGEWSGYGIGWDIGGLYYSYPTSDTGAGVADYDYFEVYGSLSHDFGVASADVGVNYSPDYFFESGDGLYVYGDVSIPIATVLEGFSLNGHVGHQSIDDNAQFGTPDYTDWSIGVSKDIGIFTFDVSYIDTDLSDSECFPGTLLNTSCGATGVFTVSSSF